MVERFNKHASVSNGLLALLLLSTLTLNAMVWTGAGPVGRAHGRQLQDASANVDQLSRTVADLSATVAQLQAANEQLMQAAVRGTSRPGDLEPRLRAIEGSLVEQGMMFRRYLEQYRRP